MKAASVQETKALAVGRFDVSAILQRYGRAGRWHMIMFYGNGLGEHSTHDTLAEAKDVLERNWAEAQEAQWEQGIEAATERFYEEGTSAQQMQYQAELDAEAAALGWDPMDGAFGPEFSAGYWPE